MVFLCWLSDSLTKVLHCQVQAHIRRSNNNVQVKKHMYKRVYIIHSFLCTMTSRQFFQGQAFLNSFNLGRYWPIRGPQVTLYIPAALLRPFPEINQLTMVELDHAPCGTKDNTGLGVQYLLGSSASLGNCSVTFVDKPELNGRA